VCKPFRNGIGAKVAQHISKAQSNAYALKSNAIAMPKQTSKKVRGARVDV
jgi:hypothetical protein